jgi:hypothetical protein
MILLSESHPTTHTPKIHSPLHSNPRNASVSYVNCISQVSKTTQQEPPCATMTHQGLPPLFTPGYELALHPQPPLPFDLARGAILCWPTPPPKIGMPHLLTHSSTVSPYRVHWNELSLWEGIAQAVSHYWSNIIPQHDKVQNVTNMVAFIRMAQRISFRPRSATDESKIRECISGYIEPVLDIIANGGEGAPLPSDRHSLFTSWSAGDNVEDRLAGMPDYVMINERVVLPAVLTRITVIFEIKNPWIVTPALIDEVINGTTLLPPLNCN